jgi:hypothetical protein
VGCGAGDVAQRESIAFATRGSGVRVPPSPYGGEKEKKIPREALTIRSRLSKIDEATDWCVRTYTTAVGLRPVWARVAALESV